MSNVEDDMAHLSIGDGEDDGVQIELDDSDLPPSFVYCFVGSFLTTSIINFLSMRSTMATVWHPLGGRLGSQLYGNRVLGISHVPNNLSSDSQKNKAMMESVNKDAIGGASVAVLGQKLGNSNLSPVEGFDVVVGSSEEEIPLANVETTKRPRFQF
ncbi:hypothetical protein V6N13_142787 [Hibiscus sabdariffa]